VSDFFSIFLLPPLPLQGRWTLCVIERLPD
jgi:hypothetical protein